MVGDIKESKNLSFNRDYVLVLVSFQEGHSLNESFVCDKFILIFVILILCVYFAYMYVFHHMWV